MGIGRGRLLGTAALIAIGTTAHAQTVELPPVTVGGDASAVPQLQTTTKMTGGQLETPQSIQVLSRETLDQRRPVTLTDALFNVSGIADLGSRRGYDNIAIRGFSASNSSVYLDGLRVERGNFNVAQELSGLQSIEVLKGPAAVLFGQGSLGGIVSQVSKRPTATPFVEASVSAGSRDFYEGTVDAGGALSDRARVRLNAVYRTADDAVDFLSKERRYVAPSVAVDLGENTTLTLLGTYVKDRTDGQYVGIPVVGSVLPNINGRIDRNRYIGEPDLDYTDIERVQIGYTLEHRFSDAWTLRHNMRFTDSEVDSIATFAGALQANQRILNRQSARYTSEDQSLATDTHIQGTFKTGPVGHTMVVGVDAYRQQVDERFLFSSIAPIDLYNPAYGARPTPTFSPLWQKRRDWLFGAYVHDRVDLTEALSVVVGGRYDSTSTKVLFRATGQTRTQADAAFTGRAGAIYRVTPAVAVYANYAQSFNPNFGVLANGGDQKPERGEQIEAGVKTEALGGLLTATASVYRLTRSNVLVANPATPGLSVQTGEQESTGFELDGRLRVTSRFSLLAAYAYTDVEVTKDTTIPVGHRPINVPRHSGSLWGTYEVFADADQSVTLGAGARYVGDREGTLPNTYTVPSYTTADAMAEYRFKNVSVQLNATNLFDKSYYASASPTGSNSVLVGDPLTVRGRLAVRF